MIFKPGTFFLVAHRTFDSKTYRKLSLAARAAYDEFLRVYNGHNNGSLFMSSRRMAALLNCHYATASRAILELIDRGMIELTSKASYGDKPKAAAYRIMEFKCDVSGMRPWQPSSTKPNSHREPQKRRPPHAAV